MLDEEAPTLGAVGATLGAAGAATLAAEVLSEGQSSLKKLRGLFWGLPAIGNEDLKVSPIADNGSWGTGTGILKATGGLQKTNRGRSLERHRSALYGPVAVPLKSCIGKLRAFEILIPQWLDR